MIPYHIIHNNAIKNSIHDRAQYIRHRILCHKRVLSNSLFSKPVLHFQFGYSLKMLCISCNQKEMHRSQNLLTVLLRKYQQNICNYAFVFYHCLKIIYTDPILVFFGTKIAKLRKHPFPDLFPQIFRIRTVIFPQSGLKAKSMPEKTKIGSVYSHTALLSEQSPAVKKY